MSDVFIITVSGIIVGIIAVVPILTIITFQISEVGIAAFLGVLVGIGGTLLGLAVGRQL